MLKLKRSQVLPIGLDLGHDSVKMLQLEASDNALSVVASARHALPDEVRTQPELYLPLAMELVRQMLHSEKFTGRQVVACVPRQFVQVKNLRLPIMPAAEIESAVQFEAKNIFPFDVEKAAIRHLPAGEVRQGADTKLEVIAMAVQQNDIDAFIEQLHRAGCIVESLDFEPSALYRGVEKYIRRREDENEVTVLVDIGVQQSRVVIGRGRDISFFKPIEIGSRQFQELVSRKLGITDDESRALRRRLIESAQSNSAGQTDSVRQAVQDATRSLMEELAKEISLCLRYYSVTFRGHRPTKVRLLGGEAGDPQLLSILSTALPIPVEPGRPLYSVDTSKMKQAEQRTRMSEWAVAFGLALKFTRGYFGARDGRNREALFQQSSAAVGNVEVVDLSQAMDASRLPATARAIAPEAANA